MLITFRVCLVGGRIGRIGKKKGEKSGENIFSGHLVGGKRG